MKPQAQDTWVTEIQTALRNEKSVTEFFPNFMWEGEYGFQTFLPIRIAEKIRSAGPESSWWHQFMPSSKEGLPIQSQGLTDPIGDQINHREGQIIHRYQNRILFLPQAKCPIHCRYCFRRNELEPNDLFEPNFEKTLNYLSDHPEVEEIIFTGGDPLVLSDKKIHNFLSEFSRFPSVKFVRFHTRFPTIIPSRFNSDFFKTLNDLKPKFEQIVFAVHINHPDEIYSESKEALLQLSKNFLTLSQTVLLKNVNDCAFTLKKLFYSLSSFGVRPYYLHHPDAVKGGMHFYLNKTDGKTIFKKLRKILPGWQLPTYVCDSPNASGKEALA